MSESTVLEPEQTPSPPRHGKRTPGSGRKREWPADNPNRRARVPTFTEPVAAHTEDWEQDIVGWGEQDQEAWETLRRAYKHGGSRYDNLERD